MTKQNNFNKNQNSNKLNSKFGAQTNNKGNLRTPQMSASHKKNSKKG